MMKILDYDVERKKIKNINLRIRPDGSVYISAPLHLHESQIENFIISKRAWIEKNKKLMQNYTKIKNELELYCDNSLILYFGKLYTLRIFKSINENININENIIEIYTNSTNIKEFIYNKLYYTKAKKLFQDRLNFYLTLTKNEAVNLRITSMKGKWGLCIPSKRKISLNIDLMKKSQLEIDSVVIHEIAHLTHPNHSKDFYNYIDKYFKNYKEINKKLNKIL